jgi:hypothetical protein
VPNRSPRRRRGPPARCAGVRRWSPRPLHLPAGADSGTGTAE